MRCLPSPARASVSETDILAARLPFAKCPKVVLFGNEVPVTVTGKYQRLKLKPLFTAFAATQFQARRLRRGQT
jgi:long-chain acyl-CoA synthetase